MLKVSYKLKLGAWSIDSSSDPRTELIELETRSSLGSAGDYCRVSVYAPPAPQPGLLEQAIVAATEALGIGGGSQEDAFSVQVRGQKIKRGDQLTVELASGDVSETVMTAELNSITSSFERTTFLGRAGSQKLADTRLNQIYENQSLSQIVKDIAGQAGVLTGDIATGSKYSYFVIHESKSLLAQLRGLAIRDGLDLFFDSDNKLAMKKFTKSSPDHTFYFGIDILDLRILNGQSPADRIVVCGESPASNQGSDTWHWIAKDLSPFRSEAGKGAKAVIVHDGTVRTKDAADGLATSKLGAIKDDTALGQLKVLGNPKVKLGDAIEVKNATKPELNGVFKVTALRHVLNKRQGYLTFIGFSGQGGAAKAGGLLGGAAGQLAGALGL